MRVLLVGNYETDRQLSMLGFQNVLMEGLRARGVEVRTIAPSARLGRAGSLPGPARKWLGYVDKYGLFLPELKRALRWADVVHVCDQGNAIYVHFLHKRPHLVTCHDLLAIRAARGELPECRTGWTGRLYQRLILAGLKQARSIVCDSEATRSDVLRVTGLPEARTDLLPIGLFRPPVPRSESRNREALAALPIAPGESFLLHVGGNQFYKNRLGVLRVYHALLTLLDKNSLRLVMAGGPFTEEMRCFVREKGLAEQVRELVRPTDDQIQALYGAAKALVFPSLYEGFGLPVIEAQACGCPVFASDRAPMTDVGGGAAVYFDPTQPESAAQTIARNMSRRDDMIARGYENIKRFTTEQMIEGYMNAYRHVLSSTP